MYKNYDPGKCDRILETCKKPFKKAVGHQSAAVQDHRQKSAATIATLSI